MDEHFEGSHNTSKYIGRKSEWNETYLIINCQANTWSKQGDVLLGVLYIIISVIGISKNIHAFYQIFKATKEKLTQSKACFLILVGNLASGDILILTFPIWISIIGLFSDRNILQTPGNNLTEVAVLLHSCCARSSIIFVMFIAIFRVLSIKSPLQPSMITSIMKMAILSILSWILVVAMSIYSVYGSANSVVYSRSAAICKVELDNKKNNELLVTGQILAPFLLPGIITLLALVYLLVFMIRMYSSKMSRYKDNTSSYRPAKERATLIMTVKLIICFVITYTPWYIYGISEFMDGTEEISENHLPTERICFKRLYWQNLCIGGFLFSSSAANPFIYGGTLDYIPRQDNSQNIAMRTMNIISNSFTPRNSQTKENSAVRHLNRKQTTVNSTNQCDENLNLLELLYK